MIGAVLWALLPNALSLAFVLSGQMPLPALLVVMMLEAMVAGTLWLHDRRPDSRAAGWRVPLGWFVVVGLVVGMRAIEDTDWSWGTLATVVTNAAVFAATAWWRRRRGATRLFTGGDVAGRFLLLLFGVVVLLGWVDTISELSPGWATRQHGTAWLSWFGWRINRAVDGSSLAPMKAAALALFIVKAFNEAVLAVRAVWLAEGQALTASSAAGPRSTRPAAARASRPRRRPGRSR